MLAVVLAVVLDAVLDPATVTATAPAPAPTPAGGSDPIASERHDDQPGDDQDGGPSHEPDDEQRDAGMAKVIPLGIFDPFKEAERRW